MRSATKEEMKSVHDYIDSISQTLLSIPTPKNATNGDMIKALLGKENVYIDKFSEEVNIYKNQVYIATIKRYWWNAPYKAESEDKG